MTDVMQDRTEALSRLRQFGGATLADSIERHIALENIAMGRPPMPAGEGSATRPSRPSPAVRERLRELVREVVRTLVLFGFVLVILNVLSSPPATIVLSLALFATWLRMVKRDNRG